MKKRFISALLAVLMLVTMVPVTAMGISRADIDSNDLLAVKQPYSGPCVIYACWYMARRRIAIESSIKNAKEMSVSDFWISATGSSSEVSVKGKFNYKENRSAITHAFQRIDLYKSSSSDGKSIVTFASEDQNIRAITNGQFIAQYTDGTTDSDKFKKILIYMLDQHPEGVVVWAHNGKNVHGILLTDYDKSTDEFYCADPAKGTGRIKLTDSILCGGSYTNGSTTQDGILKWICSFWYISDIDTSKTLCTHEVGWETVQQQNGTWAAQCKNCHSIFPIQEQYLSMETIGTGIYRVDGTNVKLSNSPYTEGKESKTLAKGTTLTIVAYTLNAYGNLWMKTDDGRWVCYIWTNSTGKHVESITKIGNLPKPAVPTGLDYSGYTDNSFSVFWTPVSGATYYKVEYSKDGVNWKKSNDYTDNTKTHYTFYNATNPPYYIHVLAGNNYGESNWCSYITCTRNHTHAWTTTTQNDAYTHNMVCSCGAVIGQDPHTFGDWFVTKAATVQSTGTKVRSCQTCGYQQAEIIPQLEHAHNWTWKYDAANHYWECDCGATRDLSAHEWEYITQHDESGHMLCCVSGCQVQQPHIFGDWVVVQKPTCTQKGIKIQSCLQCGFPQQEYIPCTGHIYSAEWKFDTNNHWHECSCGDKSDLEGHSYFDSVVPSTSTEQGYTLHTCTVCGYSYKDSYTEVRNWSGWYTEDEIQQLITAGTISKDTTLDSATQYRYRTNVKDTVQTSDDTIPQGYIGLEQIEYGEFGDWSEWQDDEISAIILDDGTVVREVKERQTFAGGGHYEYRYGRWEGQTGNSFCKEWYEYKHPGETAVIGYTDWSTTRLPVVDQDWYCSYKAHNHIGVGYKDKDGDDNWYEYSTTGVKSSDPSTRYFWEESRYVDTTTYGWQFSYRERIPTYIYYKWIYGEWGEWSFIQQSIPQDGTVNADIQTVYRFEIDDSHSHSFDTIWHSDDNYHWHECYCKTRSDVSSHSFDAGGICTVCGYVKNTFILINEENFPDGAFRNYVASNFDEDSDGQLSEAECNAVTQVNYNYADDLTGIEYFTQLKVLGCMNCGNAGDGFTSLDLSHNTALEVLDCSCNNLVALDLSHNTALKYLSCGSNYLTELDLSRNIALEELYCNGNNLTALDVSGTNLLSTDDGYFGVGCQRNDKTIVVTMTEAQKERYDSEWASDWSNERVTVQVHTHDYDTIWHSDEVGHWHECECGDKSDIAKHSFANDICTVCGYSCAILDSGYCGGEGDGTNLTWTLDKDGTLTISGTGKMADYDLVSISTSTAPWSGNISRIKKIVIGNGVSSIGNYALRFNLNLESVEIPNSVTTIGFEAFYYCPLLTDITLPNSIITIGDWSFAYCDSLTGLVIPDSVTTIGESAFDGCTGITSVTIPDSVTNIGEGAFAGCSGLIRFAVEKGNPYYSNNSDGVLFNKGQTTLVQYPAGSTQMSYIVPVGVTKIGESAFGRCTNLTSVTIPNSVTTIGEGAFSGCYNLVSVTIPESVTAIGESSFVYCESLPSITIPDSVGTIGDWAFVGCSSLTDINYTGTQEKWQSITIGEDAIPEGVTIHYNYVPLISIPGDINGDTVVDSNDLSILACHVAKIREITDAEKLAAADYNRDGKVNAADLTTLAIFIKMATAVTG